MVLNRILLDPDPPASGGGAPPIPTTPTGDVSRATFPSASSALGLDTPPNQSLDEAFNQNRQRNLPPVTVGFDTGKPDPKPAPAPTPAPAPPAEPTPAPAPAPTPTPTPEKIKVGDKEYTKEELEKIIAGGDQQQQQPPAPQPTPDPAPQPAAKPLTPEEIKAQEDAYVEARSKEFGISVDEPTVETILQGGAEGVAAFNTLLGKTYAKALMDARKSIFRDLDQDLRGVGVLSQAVHQLLGERQQLQQIGVEQAFIQAHPEFKDHLDTARSIAKYVVETYPQVKSMDQAEFIKYVADQTDKYVTKQAKQWNPNFQATSWKEYWQAQQKAAAPAVTAQPPGVPAAAPTPPPAPAAPPVRPPIAHSPAAPTFTGYDNNQHKAIAHSLREP